LIAPLFSSVCTPGVWVQVLNGGHPARKDNGLVLVCADLSVPVYGRYGQARPVELLRGGVNRQLAVCIISP
jgi:hypothetical protein